MKFLESKAIHIIILIFLMVLVSISITGISLLSLPFFYEQSTQGKVLIFLGVVILFSLLISFATRFFILSFIRQFQEKKNLVFLIIMSIFLTVTIAISSANYWAVPEIHEVKICFNAKEGAKSINVEKLVDPNTNRLYPPDSFGFNRYPIVIESGSCVNGKITILLSRMTQALMGFRLTVNVQETPPDGRFYLSINDVPAVVNFGKDSASQSVTEIVFKEGFDEGKKIDSPWRQYWFMGVKVLGIFISAVYLSLILFGLTEQIVSHQSIAKIHLNEK